MCTIGKLLMVLAGTNTIRLIFKITLDARQTMGCKIRKRKLLIAHAGGLIRENQAEMRLVTRRSERNDGLMDIEHNLNVHHLKAQ